MVCIIKLFSGFRGLLYDGMKMSRSFFGLQLDYFFCMWKRSIWTITWAQKKQLKTPGCGDGSLNKHSGASARTGVQILRIHVGVCCGGCLYLGGIPRQAEVASSGRGPQ